MSETHTSEADSNRSPEPDPAQALWRQWQEGNRPDLRVFLDGAGSLTPSQLVSVLWVDQRARWRAGEPVPAENYLRDYPALQAHVEGALELVYGEFLLREAEGKTPPLAEFVQRFPQYAVRLQNQIELHQALAMPFSPAPAETILSRPGSPPTLTVATPLAGAASHRVIGGYEILEELGHGGMGVVYKARQAGLERVVALKMIRADRLARGVEISRFRTEAEAAARLQHPNIVQIHEVGEQDGRPFFSLEFVDGPDLARHLQGKPQPAAEAAALIETLALAVHYAHEHGVVHRDLKPANILLQKLNQRDTESTEKKDRAERTKGGSSRTTDLAFSSPPSAVSSASSVSLWLTLLPKITDFGLAKLLVGATGQTEDGEILGTPSYMAPEQAKGHLQDIGPLVDVYALGAILYEALTGRPPFCGTSVLETLDLVRFTEPVPPRRLQPRCSRDLETVCLKCLHKDPRKRYASALDLAEDLRRFREGRPVQARPVGPMGRLGKWARRHPSLAALVVVSIAAVLSLLVGSGWHILVLQAAAQREHNLRGQAEENFEHSLEAVDQLLAEVADVELADVPLMEQRRRNLLRKAANFYEAFLQQRGDDPSVRRQAGRIFTRLGDIRELLNEDAEAEQAYHRAISLLEGDQLPELARAWTSLGILLKKNAARAGEAETVLRESLRLLDLQDDEARGAPEYRRDRAKTLFYLGALLDPLRGREREAEDAYRQAIGVQQELASSSGQPDDRRRLARYHNNLGRFLWIHKQLQEALNAFDEALALHRRLVTDSNEPLYRLDLARDYNNRGATRPPEAEASYLEALGILRVLTDEFPFMPRYRADLAGTQYNLARLLRTQGRLAEAEAPLRDAQRLGERLVKDPSGLPDYRHKLARTHQELGSWLDDSGRPGEAETAYRQALAALEKLVAAFPQKTAYLDDRVMTQDKLARLLLKRGKLGEPSQGAEVLLASFAAGPLATLPVLARARASFVEAGDLWERAIRETTEQKPEAKQALAAYYWHLADVRSRLGDHAATASAAEQLPQLVPAERDEYLKAAQFLGKCVLLAAGDDSLTEPQRRELEQLYGRKAVEWLRQAVAKGLLKNVTDLQGPPYEPLRRREDFQNLLKDLQEKKTIAT
jgi:serine/threonine protein kinase/tetratricopeptide (TPR) repeat protein